MRKPMKNMGLKMPTGIKFYYRHYMAKFIQWYLLRCKTDLQALKFLRHFNLWKFDTADREDIVELYYSLFE